MLRKPEGIQDFPIPCGQSNHLPLPPKLHNVSTAYGATTSKNVGKALEREANGSSAALASGCKHIDPAHLARTNMDDLEGENQGAGKRTLELKRHPVSILTGLMSCARQPAQALHSSCSRHAWKGM